MGNKVVLTKVQNEKVKELQRRSYYDDVIRELIYGESKVFNLPSNPLTSIDRKKLLEALTIGYEVEPEFKEGDWVTHENGVVSKVTHIDDRGVITTDHQLNYGRSDGSIAHMNTFSKYFSHSTPEEIAEEKERRKWSKIGRRKNEFKEKDIVKTRAGYISEVYSVGKVGCRLEGFDTSYFSEELILISPAENRLDVSE